MAEVTLTIDGELYVVEFKYSAGRRGFRDSCRGVANAGPPLEPDDAPEIEILCVRLSETYEEVLDEDWLQASEELIREKIFDTYEPSQPDYD